MTCGERFMFVKVLMPGLKRALSSMKECRIPNLPVSIGVDS